MPYLVEYTDTFGGEANYCWVRRATIGDSAKPYASRERLRDLLRRARKEVGLSGARGDVTFDGGDEIHWVPRGCCTILMIRWDDSPAGEQED